MPHCSKSWLAQEIVALYTTSALIWFVPWDTVTQLSTAFRFSSSPRNRKLTLRGQDHSPQLRAESLPHSPSTTRIPNAIGYWTTAELARTFGDAIGPSRVFVDGYFSLNPRFSDIHLFPRRYRAPVGLSGGLRKMSQSFASLARVADSLYVSSQKQ